MFAGVVYVEASAAGRHYEATRVSADGNSLILVSIEGNVKPRFALVREPIL
jgi:hypothetical protein